VRASEVSSSVAGRDDAARDRGALEVARLGPRTLRRAVIGDARAALRGLPEIGTEIDGEPWHLEVRYSKSGFAPRLSDRINAERLYEWDIVGRGRGERKASYNIGPRFPNMRHWESGERLQLPWENPSARSTAST